MDRFYDKVNKIPGGCWEWTACISGGYGQFCLDGKMFQAHRVTAWWAGLIPSLDSPLHIDHVKCQNKKCVNPAHLQAMTNSEHVKKTHACGEINQSGEANNKAKLAEAQVRDIHEKYTTGNFSQRELGEIYGVSHPTIGRILSGKNWPDIYKEYHDCI